MRHRLIQRRLELDPPLSREALAYKIGIHPKSLARIERGETNPYPVTRHKLARGLGWSLAEVHRALEEDENGPLHGHAVPAHLTHFTSLEQAATEMRSWAPLVVPALLQAPEYAAAAERVVAAGALTETEIAERVTFRLARQHALLREHDPLRLYALLDTSVLLRETGGPAVMATQLDHLRAMNERPNVEIRLTPLDGRVFAAPGAFHLLSGQAREPYIACPTDIMGIQYVENPPGLVSTYSALFAALWECSDELDEIELLGGCR
jgi:DNA-binding XRE family transcriptional regulator